MGSPLYIVSKEEIEKIRYIFRGLEDAYGVQYAVARGNDYSKKLKGKVHTKWGKVTDKLWEDHLKGLDPSLGIIPINRENKCVWGCIDIDTYPFDHEGLVKKINARQLPLIVCRSKSGGAHIFLFTQEPASAELMYIKLKEIAACLGYSNKEIFPKQKTIQKEEIGNFLNMPYHGGDASTRYAFTKEGKRATLKEFVALYGDTVRFTEDLNSIRILPEIKHFEDGPPCLQMICEQGGVREGEGVRNTFMYNVSVYHQKKYGKEWLNSGGCEKINTEFVHPAYLSPKLTTIMNSVDKVKEYNYQCNLNPLCSHCNRTLCLTRQYGVGGADRRMPVISSVMKYKSDPPIYTVWTDGKQILCESDDVKIQSRFQTKCMEVLDYIPITLKGEEWRQYVNEQLLSPQKMITQDSTGESNPLIQLFKHLKDFCTSKSIGKTYKDLGRGQAINLEDEGNIGFRFDDFWKYLTKKKWDKTPRWTEKNLTSLGAETKNIGYTNDATGKKERIRKIARQKLFVMPDVVRLSLEEEDYVKNLLKTNSTTGKETQEENIPEDEPLEIPDFKKGDHF